MKRRIFFLVVVIILMYKLFYLVPWAHVEGSFNIKDVSLVLVWGGVAWYLLLGGNTVILRNPITLLMLFYLFLIGVHVSLASFHYNQSLLDGIVAARNQFIYVAFFLFLVYLDSIEKIVRLMDILSMIAVGVLILSAVNYFIPVVFHHWMYDAENWKVTRGGIQRAFIPATPLMTLAAVWMWCRWLAADKRRWFYAAAAIMLIAGHFFHQSRGPIFGIVVAIFMASFLFRKFGELGKVSLVAFFSGLIMTAVLPSNLLLEPFITAVEDVGEGSGTVKGRLYQLEHDLEEFMDHPWIGSGLVVVRTSQYRGHDISEIAAKTRTADLGYSHWIKMYGFTGIIWLLIFYYYLAVYGFSKKNSKSNVIRLTAIFSISYFGNLVVTGVTLDHFLIPERILLMVLLAAIVVRLHAMKDVVEEEEEKNSLGNEGFKVSPSGVILASRHKLLRKNNG